jgi:hypothetical protein
MELIIVKKSFGIREEYFFNSYSLKNSRIIEDASRNTNHHQEMLE